MQPGENGFVKAYRRCWKHPVFRDLLDAAIWNYLYQNAAWKDRRVIVNGTRIELKRGQIFVSMRELAAGFCCAEARIRRLTKALTDDAMIDTLPTHRGTIITICNYELYQQSENTGDALNDEPTTHERRAGDAPIIKKKEGKKEGKEINNPPIPPLPDWLDADLWLAFKEMRRGLKAPMTAYAEKLAIKRLDGFRSKGHDPTAIIEESIRNSWKDLYEPKEKHDANPGTSAIQPRRSPSGGQQQRPAYDNRDAATRARDIGEEIIARRAAERAASVGHGSTQGQPAGSGRTDPTPLPDLRQPENLRG